MAIVTVALPVYNAMPYLPEAVESIVQQTFQDFNFIIINDGSTDGSPEYLDSIKDSRVTVIHQENRGLGATLNLSLEMCKTEYYARMDADDISLPRRLKTQLQFMQDHKDLVLLGTHIAFMAGKKLFQGPPKPLSNEMIRKSLMKGNAALCHGVSLFKTAVAKKIGGYKIRGAGQDTDFFLRMCAMGEVANLDEILYLIRVHAKTINYIAREEVTLGRTYAIECAKCRQQGVPEPTFEKYRDTWKNRSILRKAIDKLDSWSAVAYRQALLDIGAEKKVAGYLRLGCAAACRPRGVARRILGRFPKRTRGIHSI